jgi:hypothetical protein
MSRIDNYLKSCRDLSRFCSSNGWIDIDSLRYTVVMETSTEIVVQVEFDELLTQGSGNLAERVSCFGQLHLFLDRLGRVIRTEVL